MVAFKEETNGKVANALHSIAWPVGTAKCGCKKAKYENEHKNLHTNKIVRMEQKAQAGFEPQTLC